MKYFKKLIGERIYLSPKGTSEEEIQKFTEWLNDFQITDYLGRSGKYYDKLYMDILESEFNGDYIKNKNI